jgi:hypothetical protein
MGNRFALDNLYFAHYPTALRVKDAEKQESLSKRDLNSESCSVIEAI